MKLSMPGTPKSAPGPGAPPVALSPGWLQPGPSRMVGAGALALTPLPGNQCAAILVPSKEVMVTSLALAGAGSMKAATTAAKDNSPPRTGLLMARDPNSAPASGRRFQRCDPGAREPP